MAEEERLTKRERRKRARQQRAREEAAQARRARRNRILAIVGTVAGVAAVVALLVVTREPPAPTGIAIQRAAAQQAAQTAGCAPVDIPPPQSTSHFQGAAPPASAVYPVRPTHSGPHTSQVGPVGAFDDPLEETTTTHNLEHGSVIAWFDPAAVDSSTAAAIRRWATERNRAGFRGSGGAGIIAAPFPDGLSTGKAVALRAWGVALDCRGWSQQVADAFVIANFGTHGRAPESSIAGYPDGVLSFAPQPTGGSPRATGP